MSIIDLHLILVHFPIALLTLATLGYGLLFVRRLVGQTKKVACSCLDGCLWLGTLCALLAVVAGFFSIEAVSVLGCNALLNLHQLCALSCAGLYLLASVARVYQVWVRPRPMGWLTLGLVCLGFVALVMTGWYGNEVRECVAHVSTIRA